jgi:hypothetical protein
MDITMSEHNVGWERLKGIARDHPTGSWNTAMGSCWFSVSVGIGDAKVNFTWFGDREATTCRQIEFAAKIIADNSENDDEQTDDQEEE